MEIETQKKKNQSDPDYDQLNPEIIKLAHTNGWIRQAIILYLSGELTWIESLELMVTTIHKEFKLQQSLLNVVIQEQEVPRDLLEAYSRRNHKALPPPKEMSDQDIRAELNSQSFNATKTTDNTTGDCPQVHSRGDGGVLDSGPL